MFRGCNNVVCLVGYTHITAEKEDLPDISVRPRSLLSLRECFPGAQGKFPTD